MVYVPLPGLKDRCNLFKTYMSKQQHYLTARDFYFLAQQTKGYSPADIYNVCVEARWYRSRRTESATHFKKDPLNPGDFWPCMPNDNGREAQSIDIGANVCLAPINLKDMEKGLWDAKKTPDPSLVTKLNAFAKEFGQHVPELKD
jgi:SpoVK/Ycf46/Vps4 family AAA+-type ATPase